ncbi:MAG: amino acid permease [Acidobacteriota bacterium]
MHLFRTKPIEELEASASEEKTKLKRSLGAVDITALGIGAIIGAGIFATTGTAAAGGASHLGAGPALVISYVFTALVCGFCALCYAEFASMIPIAGSAYTYSYATLGELIAWVIGWDLILEYAVGNVAVAVSWAGYFRQLLAGLHIHIPLWMCVDIRTAHRLKELAAVWGSKVLELAPASVTAGDIPRLVSAVQADPGRFGLDAAQLTSTVDGLQQAGELLRAPHLFGFHLAFNLPAIAIVALLTVLLVIGIKESARVNSLMVALKLVVVIGFIAVGAFYVKPEHWSPFAPNGWTGVWTGAALVFFAYIGFDAVSTTAEEARNPQRDMPIGMIASLIICTILYIGVAVVLTGIVKYDRLGVAEPLALAMRIIHLDWAAGIISFGAVASMTAVLLVFQLGQPRIFFSMSRDGLLPPSFARVHPRFRTPHVTTILTGVFVAFFAGFVDINEAVELTNIGTLFAFVLVCAGILVLRHTEPNRPRPFRTPWSPYVPVLGIAFCIYLMLGLPLITWIRFFLWLAIGLLIYFCYGVRHSKLRAGR